MPKIKDEDIKKQTTTKEAFEALLAKACETEPKPLPTSSKTKAAHPSCDCTETDTH